MDAEILQLYDVELVDQSGRGYTARACGRERGDGTWEGWLEFERDDELLLATERETTQPNRADLVYWATGLTSVYLEGALERALDLVEPAKRHHKRRPRITLG